MKRYMCIGKTVTERRQVEWVKHPCSRREKVLQISIGKRRVDPVDPWQRVRLSAWFFFWAQQGIRRVTETLERYMKSEHRGNPGFLSCIEPREVRRTQSRNGCTGHPGEKARGSLQRFHRTRQDSTPVLRRKHESDKGLRWSCWVSWGPVWCGCHRMISCTLKGQRS